VTCAFLAIGFGLGSAMLFVGDGAGNPAVLAWYLVVIAGAIRSGSAAAVLVALGTSLEYGVVLGDSSLLPAIGQVFLFVTVALVFAIRTRELERERRIAIPRAAQIIAVADAYEAITTPRPYRRAITPEAAVAELRACAGTQFDPAVVEAFVAELNVAPTSELEHLTVYQRAVDAVRFTAR